MDKRKKVMAGCRQVIVKVGTRLLTDPIMIPQLIRQIAELRKMRLQPLLVSSGAVGTGLKQLGMEKRPRKLAEIQALAAVGQGRLMALYNDACAQEGFHAAQLLLTRDDLRNRARCINVQNCIQALWAKGILPIVNENDSVSVDELKFSDNDILSGMLGALTGAQLTIILTTESGLRERVNGVLGDRVSVVEAISQDILNSAGGTDDPKFSIGGMTSKLNAAQLVTGAGGYLWIADGRDPEIISKIIAGEDVGTLFLPRRRKISSRKLWIGAFAEVFGRITVDEGAAEALIRSGSSLLPSGVRGITGHFEAGDAVEIAAPDGSLVARGIAECSCEVCDRIKGMRADQITALLGADAPGEMVHRDNLTVIK